jgi:hypothetical protein
MYIPLDFMTKYASAFLCSHDILNLHLLFPWQITHSPLFHDRMWYVLTFTPVTDNTYPYLLMNRLFYILLFFMTGCTLTYLCSHDILNLHLIFPWLIIHSPLFHDRIWYVLTSTPVTHWYLSLSSHEHFFCILLYFMTECTRTCSGPWEAGIKMSS